MRRSKQAVIMNQVIPHHDNAESGTAEQYHHDVSLPNTLASPKLLASRKLRLKYACLCSPSRIIAGDAISTTLIEARQPSHRTRSSLVACCGGRHRRSRWAPLPATSCPASTERRCETVLRRRAKHAEPLHTGREGATAAKGSCAHMIPRPSQPGKYEPDKRVDDHRPLVHALP